MRNYVLFIALILFCFTGSAGAEELYGLAMHGAPKYTAEYTHLDYVNPDAPKGGTLRQAAIGTFDTLNPYAIKGNAAQGLNLVYDRLMARVWDEAFTMYPLIAESVEVPEDRSSLTVHINPKARFDDGSPVTADDVLFSFETLKAEGRPNMRRIYKLVSSAEKLGPLTVKFSFGEGYDQETAMILAMMPVLSKAWWEGRDFSATLLEPPLTNGPYKIASVDPGKRIVYERNPDYWARDLLPNKGQFNFGKVVYDYYRDDTVAFEAFKAGDLDLRREFDAGKWTTAYDFPAIEKGEIKAEAIRHGRPERVRALIFNTRRAPFDDIRVREALQYALDFDWINENLFHGQYQQVDSYFPNSELAAPGGEVDRDKDARKNLRKAAMLLKEAGWVVDNGVLTKDGKPFTFEIVISSPEDEKVVLAFQRSLERLGIKVNIRQLDSAAFLGRLNDYDYDMVLYYWQNSLSPGTEQMLYWTCEAKEKKAQWNYAGICDPEIDSLSAAIARAKTREELVENARALDHALMAGHYIIPLYYNGADYVAYKARIHRPDTTPVYGMVIESWWEE